MDNNYEKLHKQEPSPPYQESNPNKPPPPNPYPNQPYNSYPGQNNFNNQNTVFNQSGPNQAVNSTIVFNQNNQPKISMTVAILFSCFVYFCFNIICGGIAFIIAVVGNSEENDNTRKSLRIASLVISAVGIFSTILLIIILVCVFVVGAGVATSTYIAI